MLREKIARLIFPKAFSENDTMKAELLERGHVFFQDKKLLGLVGYTRGFVHYDGEAFKLARIYLPND